MKVLVKASSKRGSRSAPVSASLRRGLERGQRNGRRVELGQYIVADPLVCHGKPTYKGTRIMVWQILEALADGESVDEVVKAWGGRVSKSAVLETIRLAGGALLDLHGRLKRHLNGQLAA